jgi:hypothetical protein
MSAFGGKADIAHARQGAADRSQRGAAAGPVARVVLIPLCPKSQSFTHPRRYRASDPRELSKELAGFVKK